MEAYLSHELPAIMREQTIIHGGNQSWLPKKYVQKSGCGLIAGTDLLLYFSRYKKGCRTELFGELPSDGTPVSSEVYSRLTDRMRKRFFPVLPGLGMSGWALMVGVNLYFLRFHLSLRACWRPAGPKLWKHMEEMLSKNIPVPMAIGQNIPFPWTNHRLAFYMKKTDGTYAEVCRVKAHFVTVTGMDDSWLRITSWGRGYYINRKEYEEYIKKYSSMLVCGILTVKKRRK